MQVIKLLDEIIDNAAELPLESQNWLLLIAKSMRYTRDCVIRQSEAKQSHKSPKQTTSSYIGDRSCGGEEQTA